MQKIVLGTLLLLSLNLCSQSTMKNDVIASIGMGVSTQQYLIYDLSSEPQLTDYIQSMTLPVNVEYYFCKWAGVGAMGMMTEQEIFTNKHYRSTMYDAGLRAYVRLSIDSSLVDLVGFGGAGMNVFNQKSIDGYFEDYQMYGKGFSWNVGLRTRFYFNKKYNAGLALNLEFQRCKNQEMELRVLSIQQTAFYHQGLKSYGISLSYFYNFHKVR